MKDSRFACLLVIAFWPLTALVLFCDSRHVAEFGVSGQLWSNVLTPAFLLLLMSRMKPQRQWLVALFVPLSALGEAVFSLLFGLYRYRLGGVPLYVPFGHSVLMSIGLLLAESDFVSRYEGRVRGGLLLFHGGLVGGTLLWLGDTLSAVFAVIFCVLLRRGCGRPFYLILGVLVLYVEILGTVWGCWVWAPHPFGVLHTINPPPGAFTCYALADIMAMKIAARLNPFKYSDWENARGSLWALCWRRMKGVPDET